MLRNAERTREQDALHAMLLVAISHLGLSTYIIVFINLFIRFFILSRVSCLQSIIFEIEYLRNLSQIIFILHLHLRHFVIYYL